MLLIPNLTESPFEKINAFISFPQQQLSESEHEDLSLDDDHCCKAQIDGERTIFLTLEICPEEVPGIDSTEVHAALSVSFHEPPSTPQLAVAVCQADPLQMAWKQSDPDSIWTPLGLFLGKAANLFVECSFSIERDEIPLQSLVASMIGLRTLAGEEQFLLSGAQFAVRGFPDDTVSWYLKPGSYGKTVSGQLVRKCVEKFHRDTINDAIHVIEARFRRVVRAESKMQAHATS